MSNLPTIAMNVSDVLDIEKQSVQVEGGVWRNIRSPNALVDRSSDDIRTTYDMFKDCCTKFAVHDCLGSREKLDDGTVGDFKFLTFQQVYTRARNFAAGLVNLGITPKQHIGIWSKNRVEWQVVAEGATTQSIIPISLYDTLGEESSEYIIKHGEITTVCCSSEVLTKLSKVVPKCDTVKFIICFDAVSEETASQFSIPIHTIAQVEDLGQKNPIDDIPPQPEDLFTIMYTSGTTGMPKGVMITQGNMVAMVAASLVQEKIAFDLTPEDDALIGFLPLAHIFGRVVECLVMQRGVKIGYWQGNPLLLTDDIQKLKPTLLATVPRILDRVYDKIQSTLNSSGWVSRKIFEQAYAIKKSGLAKGLQAPWCDWLVFDKIKQALGGRLKLVLSSGAPLRPEVQEFISVAFGASVSQAYGLTEISGAGFEQLTNDFSFGHVGSVVPCNEVKLVSVPEMNYFNDANPPAGEVCYRGASVSLGYYKDEEKTKEVFDEEGWFHSGDIAIMLPNGTLKIVDRLKNIQKLSQGEYVSLENVEGKLGQCKLLSRIWIYGDSFKSCIVAVGVVNAPILVQLAKDNGIPNASLENIKELSANKKVNELVLKDLTQIAIANKLQGFEQVKAIHLVDYDFDTINCVTPTLKLQRPQLRAYYKDVLDQMYKSLGQ